MRQAIPILLLLASLLAIALSAPQSQLEGGGGGHVRENFESLRDLINPSIDAQPTVIKGKKPKKYKCIVVEDGEDEEMVAAKLSQDSAPAQMDKNKFVFIEADEEQIVTATSTEQAPISVAQMPTSRFHQYQQQQQQNQPQQQRQSFQIQEESQQPSRGSAFLQGGNNDGIERITEEEATLEYPSFQQQQPRYQQKLVTPPTQPPSSFQQQYQQQQQQESRPQLKQIHLPKARGFSAISERNNFPAAATTTLPPEIANAPKDSQGRPLILAPEHCAQIRHYAQMYGVSDVKTWVHSNCGFAQTYLPTATCEEIDILVGSCYRNNPQ